MAELLVKAKPHWKDSWTTEKIKSLSTREREQYNARSQIGDIIIVKPDGWRWGKEECLPNFVIIKIPNLSYKGAKKYEEALMNDSEPSIMLKHRKYQIPNSIIENAKVWSNNSVKITALQKDIFISNIIKKVK